MLITDGQGKLLRSIDCGTDGDSEPYYASLVAEGADGSIYVADTRYARPRGPALAKSASSAMTPMGRTAYVFI